MIFKKQVRFLGKLVTKDSNTMDPAEIGPIQVLKQKKPTTIGELRKLLRFISYYCSYIPNFSHIAKPLYDLLSSDKAGKGKVRQVGCGRRKQSNGGQLPSCYPVEWSDEQ